MIRLSPTLGIVPVFFQSKHPPTPKEEKTSVKFSPFGSCDLDFLPDLSQIWLSDCQNYRTQRLIWETDAFQEGIGPFAAENLRCHIFLYINFISFTPNSSISRWFHPDSALRWVVKIFRRMEDWHGGLSLDVCRKEARKSHGVASGKHVDVFFSAVFFESHLFRELWLFLGVQLMEIKQLVFKVEMIFLESANMLLVCFFFFFFFRTFHRVGIILNPHRNHKNHHTHVFFRPLKLTQVPMLMEWWTCFLYLYTVFWNLP